MGKKMEAQANLLPAEVKARQRSPGSYRFFVKAESLRRLEKAINQGDCWLNGFGSEWAASISLEIIPVAASLAEANPEAVAGFVEVTLDWGKAR